MLLVALASIFNTSLVINTIFCPAKTSSDVSPGIATSFNRHVELLLSLASVHDTVIVLDAAFLFAIFSPMITVVVEPGIVYRVVAPVPTSINFEFLNVFAITSPSGLLPPYNYPNAILIATASSILPDAPVDPVSPVVPLSPVLEKETNTASASDIVPTLTT